MQAGETAGAPAARTLLDRSDMLELEFAATRRRRGDGVGCVDAQELRTVLEARGLRKVYQMGEVDVVALQGVDLVLHEGELCVILGASGSGKSTLLNILGGLDGPTAGTLSYRGQVLDADDEPALTQFRRAHVGFVFQFYNLVPSLTARENVELVTDLVDDPMSAEEALTLVGLGDRLDHFPGQLSGGEQQRVAIARAVAKRPDILLCDEPTGALDAMTGKIVLAVIAKINRELGTTTAVITHNAVIGEMADRVLTMAGGTIRHERVNASPVGPEALSW